MGRPCQHTTCECETREGETYCSAYCANAAEEQALPGYADVGGACACGHAGCHANDAPTTEPGSQIGLGPRDM